MKKSKIILSLFLSILMLISSLSPAFAFTSEEWRTYWNDTAVSHSGLSVQPGTDGSERNFSWYIPEGEGRCSVLISSSPDMADPVEFIGEAIDTWQGDKCAKVKVTGLKKGQTYYYACVSGGVKGGTYELKTIPDNNFTALFVSDIHIAEADAENDALFFDNLIKRADSKNSLDMIISAGDQTMNGLRTELEGITASPESRNLTFAFSVGNHEKAVDYRFFKNVPNEHRGKVNNYQGSDYWFVKGNVLFLFINSNNCSGKDHADFIEEAVKKNPDIKWRVAVMHHDLYADTIDARKNQNRLLRSVYCPMFDEYDIDLVLMGHSHHFSVSDAIYNGKVTDHVENGKDVYNPAGTVYAVSSSITCMREKEEGLHYSDYISIGMDSPLTPLYNIIDFSDGAIDFRTYNYDTDEEYASFRIVKDENCEPVKFSPVRKLQSVFVNFLSLIAAYFKNIEQHIKLRDRGYDVPVFDCGK